MLNKDEYKKADAQVEMQPEIRQDIENTYILNDRCTFAFELYNSDEENC